MAYSCLPRQCLRQVGIRHGRGASLSPCISRPFGFVGLQGVESGEYVYDVTNLDLSDGNVPIFKVRIGQNFDRWHVTRCQ